jgi:hypothetical protein
MHSTVADPALRPSALLRQHAVLAGLVTVYVAVAIWLSSRYGVTVNDNKIGALLRDFALRVPQMVFFVVFWRLIYLTYVQRVTNRGAALKADVRAFLSDRDRIVGGLIGVAIMTPMLLSFANVKNLIPVLNPFGWDVWFKDLDAALHFGVLPHEPLHAVFGHPLVISFITGIYNMWLFLMYLVLLVACFLRPGNADRMRFLLAFVLTWAIGGNVIATLFSSAGPVYYDRLGLGGDYDGLMAILQAHAATGALTVVETQDLLWRFYTREPSINAISAFPSMHVASSVLMALFAFRWSRLSGWLMTAFATIIMIGSVLLAWHYAVDGYAGAVIAVMCWFLAKPLVALSHPGRR